jgi:hypothetical protein
MSPRMHSNFATLKDLLFGQFKSLFKDLYSAENGQTIDYQYFDVLQCVIMLIQTIMFKGRFFMDK